MSQAIIMVALMFFIASQSSWVYVGLFLFGMVALFLVNLIVRQESMLYVPCVMPGMQTPANNPEGYRSPAEKGLEFEEVNLRTSDGLKIHAWFIQVDKEKAKTAPTLLFCHANAGNIGLRVPNFAHIVERLEANILAFDYRGYGFSDGQPSEEGLIEDALAAWAWLDEAAKAGRINGQRVFVFARSLGGAVAIALSKSLKDQGNALPCGLILENTFASIPMLVDSLFPWLAFKALKDRFFATSMVVYRPHPALGGASALPLGSAGRDRTSVSHAGSSRCSCQVAAAACVIGCRRYAQ